MKARNHARDIRTVESRKRKTLWARNDQPTGEEAAKPPREKPAPLSPQEQQRIFEAEAKEFLAYLEKEHRIWKNEPEQPSTQRVKPRAAALSEVNLETGMPTVEEALTRMNLSMQEIRCSGARVIRLIHGYGSSGRGGKIKTAVHAELNTMKKKRLIRDFVTGDHFGPFDASARRLVEQFPWLARDRDYGRGNQGITIVVLS